MIIKMEIIMKSWLKFFFIPLLPIALHMLLTSFFLKSLPQDNLIFNFIYILLGFILIVFSIFLMLHFAPKSPFLFSGIYAFSLWFIFVFLLSMSLSGLATLVLSTFVAMFIFYIQNKKATI